MLKTMLIDDEPESLQVISSLIGMYCHDVEIVGAYTDPEEGLNAIFRQQPHVLLLDIEMPGMTGLELYKRLPNGSFDVVFITAHNQYALKAIKLSALDYILKPVDPLELQNALLKASNKLKEKLDKKQQEEEAQKQKEILNNLLYGSSNLRNRQQQKIALPTFTGLTYLKMDSILFIEADQSYCQFKIEDDTSLTISKNIGTYEKVLDDSGFMRVHRSYIINLLKVEKFGRDDGGYVVLENQSRVEVSKSKRDELLQRLSEL